MSLDEAHMAATPGEFQFDSFGQFVFRWHTAWPHEGVVRIVQDQGGFPYGWNELAATALPVIVIGAGKTMQRGGDFVVELAEVFDFFEVDVQR